MFFVLMAQSSTITDANRQSLTIDANDQSAPTEEDVIISPVYKRSKDDPSGSPNSTRLRLSDEQIIGVLIQFGYTEQQIKAAMKETEDKADIFVIKKYLDDHRPDPLTAYKKFIDENLRSGRLIQQNGDDQKEPQKVVDSVVSTDDIDAVEIKEDDADSNEFRVHVFVRMRPLIRSEIDNEDGQIVTDTKFVNKTKSTTLCIEDSTARNVRKSAIKRPGKGSGSKSKKEEKKKMKIFKGFSGVLFADHDNRETFNQCILPSMDRIWSGHTVCSFAYGHTGSGKTYTIMGYDEVWNCLSVNVRSIGFVH